ncbi:MAG: MGMT family protein [Candidatus Helarchaeota archaeon]
MDEIINSDKWKKLTEFEKKVLLVTAKIPSSKISTYAQIAEVLGNKNFSRAVGNALNKNPFAPIIPCHRVIKSSGHVGGFARGSLEKEKILREENIKIKNHKINLEKYLVRINILLED